MKPQNNDWGAVLCSYTVIDPNMKISIVKGPASNFFLTTDLLVKNHSDREPPGESSAKKILEN